MMSPLLAAAAGLVLVGLLTVFLRSARVPRGKPVSPIARDPDVPDFDVRLERFRRALKIPTVTHSDYSANDRSRFFAFQDFLLTEFAGFLESCEVHRFDCYGLAIRWPAHPGGSHKPLLYIAHYDVVPVDGQDWSRDPFAGESADGFVYGRGSLDTKNSLMAILEGASLACENGFTPRRDIWFAFGGDEESASTEGAATMARWFEQQGIRFAWVFDEGGIIARDMIPGVKGNAALVGVAEKGFANYLLESRSAGGHSSTPSLSTALGRVGRSIDRIESSPRNDRIPETMVNFLIQSAAFQKIPLRIVMSNLWLFAPLVRAILRKRDSSRAMLHSTFAPTMAGASSKENILPSRAWAVVNVRIAPGETIASVLQRLRTNIRDSRVDISVLNMDEANDPVLPGNPRRQEGFLRSVELALGDSTELLAAFPYLMTGSTDSKYYASLAEEVYRFVPMLLDAEELARVHSADERISSKNYRRMISFYRRHIELSASGESQ